MIYSKCAEMFAEAIPAGVLQMYVFVTSSNRSTAAAASILVSALTTGFSSALVSYGECYISRLVQIKVRKLSFPHPLHAYCSHRQLSLIPSHTLIFAVKTLDFDTSPKKRRETPEFYGFVPPTGRGFVFLLMMVNSTVQFLAKIMSIALLAAVSKTWAFGYLVGDTCLFLIYKLAGNDLIWFIPVQSYIGSIGLGLFWRTTMKVRKRVVNVTFYIRFLTDLFICNTTKQRSLATSQLCYNSETLLTLGGYTGA